MATGGKKDHSRSSFKGSDFVFDYTCTPCTKKGLNNEAINYCVECSEYFCGACTKQHKKFGGTSDHNVVNRSLTKRSGVVPPSPVVRETCREHHGERLTTYCADHDLVVCNICATVDHPLCGGVSYIPKVAGSANQSKEVNKVKKQISESLKTNDQTKVSLQRSLKSADQEKKDQHTRIQNYTDRLIKHASYLEKAAIVDVEDNHNVTTEKLRTSIRSLDDASTMMKTRLSSLNNAKTNSEAQVFVDFKRGAQEVETARQLQQDLASSTSGKVMSEFVVREDVEHFLTEVRSLGQFTALEQLAENKALRVELLGEHNAHVQEDQQPCCINDSFELRDGAILIADGGNNCLKKLSKSSYMVTERLALPSFSSCICRISNDVVAVTLTDQKMVQFVKVAGCLRLTRSFKVGGSCRGVVCSKDELFVVCGGYQDSENLEPEGPGHVEVYGMSGSPLRKIQFDNRGRQLFSWPLYITASASGDKLHVTDFYRSVITMDKQGNVLSTFSHHALHGAWGIYTVAGDNILVSGFYSDNVVQLGPGGEMVAQLLTGKDGIEKPMSVCPLRDNTRLILTEFESNTIKIYSLKS